MGESGNSYLFISQPMMPKATQTPTSKAFLLMEKAPSREMTRMMGRASSSRRRRSLQRSGREAADDQHAEVCQHQSCEHAVDGRQLGDVHHGAGGDALHDEGTQQDGGDGVTGDAQRQQGDHSAAGAAVVGGLGSSNAVGDAGAVQLGVLAGGLAGAVGNEDGDVTACAGDGADEGADEAAGEDVGPDLLDGLPIGQDVGDLLVWTSAHALRRG